MEKMTTFATRTASGRTDENKACGADRIAMEPSHDNIDQPHYDPGNRQETQQRQ